MLVGGVLLASAMTACSAPPIQPSENTATSPIASSPTLSPTALPQSTFSPTALPVSPRQSAASLEPMQQAAVQVIQDYYNAIAHRNYKQAYLAWDGEGAASQQSFEQFKQGFADTASTAVAVGEPGRLDGAAGSSYIEIPVTVTATTTAGTQQRFRGSYVLRRVNDVPGSTVEQRQWHLYSANITPVSQ
ncbi:MAG TPA: hypothetical protein V6C57_08760 [Coleofasciculaceae cyanobacterium]